MSSDPFHFNDASLEAQNARALAIDLIAAWLGGEQLELGEERNRFITDEVLDKVMALDPREMVHLAVSLTFIGSVVTRAAAQLPVALDELEVDVDAFTAECGVGDPVGYLRGLEIAIGQSLRGEGDA